MNRTRNTVIQIKKVLHYGMGVAHQLIIFTLHFENLSPVII